MIPDLITQNTTSSFEFLQISVPVVLSLALILMIADAIMEAKTEDKLKAELKKK